MCSEATGTPGEAGTTRAAKGAAGGSEGRSSGDRSLGEAGGSQEFSGWCRHGGAPLVGQPVLDDSGRLYLLTADGYLHAFERDGRYRFSYTVSGTPLGSPSLRPSDGAILVGTTRRLIYAITQQGGLYFQARTVAPVWSGLYPLDDDAVVYLGLDRRVYALSNFGGALYRVLLPGQPVGEPVIGEDGVVWIPLEHGVARLHRALSLSRVAIETPIDELVALGKGAIVISQGRAGWLDGGQGWVDLGPARAAFGNGQRGVVVAPDGTAITVSRSGHVEELLVSSRAKKLLSGVVAPGVLRQADALVPVADGRLLSLPLDRACGEELLPSGLGAVAGLVSEGGQWAAHSAGGRVCVAPLESRRDGIAAAECR